MAEPELVTGKPGSNRCDGCERGGFDAVVQVGEVPDWERASATLCRDCLLAALALLPSTEAPVVRSAPCPEDWRAPKGSDAARKRHGPSLPGPGDRAQAWREPLPAGTPARRCSFCRERTAMWLTRGADGKHVRRLYACEACGPRFSLYESRP